MFADLVLYNGEIVTMDKDQSIYRFIAIKNDHIMLLGTNESIKGLIGPKTKVIDLEGKTVIPGFIDAHQHLFISGFNLVYVHCNQTSIKEMVDVIQEKANVSKPDDWIIGWGYDEANLIDERHPDQYDFEDIENPIFLNRYCAHAAVVNRTVLELAGIDEHTTVKNGEIVRDANGQATGLLKEQAVDIVRKIMPPYTKEQMKEAIKLVSEHNVARGITSVHEAGMGFFYNLLDEFHVLHEMVQEQRIPLRIYAMILDKYINDAKDLNLLSQESYPNLRVGTIKMFADGTISGKTAAISQDYKNSPGNKGMLMYSDEELKSKVLDAHQLGFQIAIHAIGDKAIEQVLDAYEAALKKYPRKDHRHRIEHAMVTNNKLLERMKKLEIIPVPQPTLVHQAGDVYLENLDSSMIPYVFANKKYLNYGLAPAGSSDFPITPSSPLLGIYAAMCRETAKGEIFSSENRINLYEALKMYTINAAKASFEENVKGSLEIGKLGDLTVLPSKFLEFSAYEVRETKVEMTIIGGRVVYHNKFSTLLKEEIL
ncbi:amidohydrolase [Metabacillus sp. B2-18]|uniref:amidohydrolase n=1 Tax=Metabacillus sp. B2-18 TaxID=2897333 RepID=UPI001E5F8537|nr:amidohydrolase [Metabacillus sp. B2-18]UGB32229.1 amidohydrolase [Metabacillus sp. B2-18]